MRTVGIDTHNNATAKPTSGSVAANEADMTQAAAVDSRIVNMFSSHVGLAVPSNIDATAPYRSVKNG